MPASVALAQRLTPYVISPAKKEMQNRATTTSGLGTTQAAWGDLRALTMEATLIPRARRTGTCTATFEIIRSVASMKMGDKLPYVRSSTMLMDRRDRRATRSAMLLTQLG